MRCCSIGTASWILLFDELISRWVLQQDGQFPDIFLSQFSPKPFLKDGRSRRSG